MGNSSIVGIGGDPIVGSDFIDILELYENDDETEMIVMVGEIGGDAEERAADFIAEHVSKPVVAYIAGFTAPPGKQMGHAGAIISGSSGTAEAKKEALEAKGVRVGKSPTETAQLAVEAMQRRLSADPRRRAADRADVRRRARCSRRRAAARCQGRPLQGRDLQAGRRSSGTSSTGSARRPRRRRRAAAPRPLPAARATRCRRRPGDRLGPRRRLHAPATSATADPRSRQGVRPQGLRHRLDRLPAARRDRLWRTGDAISPECYEAALERGHDAQAAVRYLRANASASKVDPKRIAMGGDLGRARSSRAGSRRSRAQPGESGNPGSSSAIAGFVSISGGLPGGALRRRLHGARDPLRQHPRPGRSLQVVDGDGGRDVELRRPGRARHLRVGRPRPLRGVALDDPQADRAIAVPARHVQPPANRQRARSRPGAPGSVSVRPNTDYDASGTL